LKYGHKVIQIAVREDGQHECLGESSFLYYMQNSNNKGWDFLYVCLYCT